MFLRLLKWLLVWLSLPGASHSAPADAPRLGPFEKPHPRELGIPQEDEHFSAYEALNGSFSSPGQCSQISDALWVEVEGRGECIRFYAEGLEESGNQEVLVYFGGDVILRTSWGVRFIASSYFRQSPARLHAEMAAWSQQAGRPAIYLARPGTYGSSGDHNLRRYPREVALVDRALDMIKARYRIASFILAGQSGGGHIAASLLNRRQDIAAMVISSGLVSVKRAMAYWDRRWKIPARLLYDAREFYDPIDDIGGIRADPPPSIYVISDPEDQTVPFFSQLHYVRRLRAAGFKPQHIYARALDRRRHVLARQGKLVAAMLARGADMKNIRRMLMELDLKTMQ